MPAFGSAHTTKGDSAPADEYFGKMQMSILGIRNELKTLESRVESDPEAAESDIKIADDVEDSIEAWALKYPRDSWLPDACAHLETLYAHVSALEGRLHLAAFVLWMHAHLRNTPLDEATRAQAAQLFNVPEHTSDLAKTTAAPVPTTTP